VLNFRAIATAPSHGAAGCKPIVPGIVSDAATTACLTGWVRDPP
jgi:hypothetical protein